MSQFHRPVVTHARRKAISPVTTVIWPGSPSVDEWMKTQNMPELKAEFATNGFGVIKDILTQNEVKILSDLYNMIISGRLDVSSERTDLVDKQPQRNPNHKENILQVMWPCLYVQGLDTSPIRERLRAVAKYLLGDDMEFDFDMMLAKPPQTDQPTPFHQDEHYWMDMPDKKAISFWMAIDDTSKDNGCMWFVAGDNAQPMRKHLPVADGSRFFACDATEEEATACPLTKGSCTIHLGRTVHYSRGNTTDGWRRGYIMNFRPDSMVQYERDKNFDHGHN